jgi:hypothetical protein
VGVQCNAARFAHSSPPVKRRSGDLRPRPTEALYDFWTYLSSNRTLPDSTRLATIRRSGGAPPTSTDSLETMCGRVCTQVKGFRRRLLVRWGPPRHAFGLEDPAIKMARRISLNRDSTVPLRASSAGPPKGRGGHRGQGASSDRGLCGLLINRSDVCRLERGIRSLGHPLDSVSYANHIAKNARNAGVAVGPCSFLPPEPAGPPVDRIPFPHADVVQTRWPTWRRSRVSMVEGARLEIESARAH